MSMRCASLKKAGKAREAHHQSNMYSIFSLAKVVSHAKFKKIKINTEGRASACYVILPSQSTICDIDISRTIGIGLHKQWVMDTYVQIQVQHSNAVCTVSWYVFARTFVQQRASRPGQPTQK